METSFTMELVNNVMDLVNNFLELVLKNFKNGAFKQFFGARKQCAPRGSCGAIRPSGSPAHASGQVQWRVEPAFNGRRSARGMAPQVDGAVVTPAWRRGRGVPRVSSSPLCVFRD